MLHDDGNYLYICFLTPVVKEFDQINKFFQATNADPEAMSQQLNICYVALKRRVCDNSGNELATSRVDFGTTFQSESLRCSRENPHICNQLLNVKERCKKFLQDLLLQVEQRLPANKDIINGLSLLKPGRVLSHINRAPFEKLPFQHLLQEIDDVEDQYRKILLQPWSEEIVFTNGVPDDAVEFWAAVQSFQDSVGLFPYKLLATYALACLTTPVSNAFVERIFSHINATKTESRNRLGIKMVESITRIRTSLMVRNKCCKDIVITKEMLRKFNVHMYDMYIGAGSRVPGGAQAPPELFLAPPEPFEPPLTIEKIMH